MRRQATTPSGAPWKGLVLFTVFLALYVRGVGLLQAHDAAWAEWVVGTLATVPGVLLGLFAFRVLPTVTQPRAQDDD